MSDQIERAVETLSTYLKAIITSIQKTQTYKDGNTYSLAVDTVVEITAASALLALLEEITNIVGSLAGSTTLAARLDLQPGCVGSSAGASALLALLKEITNIVGSLAGTSSINGIQKVSREFYGSAAGISGVLGFANHHLFDGVSAGSSTGAGDLDVSTQLKGKSESLTIVYALKLDSPPSDL